MSVFIFYSSSHRDWFCFGVLLCATAVCLGQDILTKERVMLSFLNNKYTCAF